ncbi:lipoprotein [Catenovulum agarivorans DS-2]|uniref:Lipoprotein n=1 Tax=Catenovulum agarivorans DS-2 TaxID=1328313 RepID=W7QDE6_9ALTE|nr:flagella assembly protein FlgT [Catenovulum agarivorans]EWH09936.1 lipoprotein [Catenovulum agarivorans DS-2]
MKILTNIIYGMLLSLICTASATAAWYQASASSRVINGNIAQARQAAIEEAVKQTLLFSGASITSSQQVTNGLLTQDMFMVRSSGVVNEIELLDETIHKGELSVTVRADIFADTRQCYASDYKKAITVLPLQIRHNEHAKIGGLYQLGMVLGEQIYQKMTSHSQNVEVRDFYQNPILDTQENKKDQVSSNQAPVILQQIARQTDSQLVISGELVDLSIGSTSNKLTQWLSNETAERFFEMRLYLHDALTGERLQQFDYFAQTMWEFDLKQRVDLTSRRFWYSAYGQIIQQSVAKAVAEIDGSLACVSAKARIIDVDAHQVRFNLGRNNNVQAGDIFTILHQASFVDKNGISRPHFIVSRHQIEVTQVYGQSAIAVSQNKELLANIQAGDVVRPFSVMD